MIFINIPNTENPARGTLLVNMKNYVPEYRERANDFVHPIDIGERTVKVRHESFKEILVGHEIFGLMNLEIDQEYQTSSTFAYHFSEEFLRPVVEGQIFRSCESLDKEASNTHTDIFELKLPKEKLEKYLSNAQDKMEKREKLNNLLINYFVAWNHGKTGWYEWENGEKFYIGRKTFITEDSKEGYYGSPCDFVSLSDFDNTYYFPSHSVKDNGGRNVMKYVTASLVGFLIWKIDELNVKK